MQFAYYIRSPKRGILVPTEQINEVQAIVLKELIADGRKTVSEIAKNAGLTRDSVKDSYEALENKGIIKGATIHINYKSFGYKAVAHMLVIVDPSQEVPAIDFLRKMPQTYAVYSRGPRGNLDVTIIIKTLRELDHVKEAIKSRFSVSQTKTVIWTDVKEMHYNLALMPGKLLRTKQTETNRPNVPRTGPSKRATVDEIDQKIADKLALNGRASMEEIAEEIGISVDTAKRRYDRLKRNGILKVTIQFDPVKIGYLALGVFFTVASNANMSSVIDAISSIPDVISIMKTTGDYDLLVYALIRDIDQLLSLQSKLGRIQGITRIDSEILPMLNKWPSPRQCISTF